MLVQQGNGQVLVSWDITAGATSYKVYRSTDGVTYSLLSSPSPAQYLDTSATIGTMYWYQVAAHNASGDSGVTAGQSVVPAGTAQASLSQIRLMSQQRADRVASQFVTTTEWNSYINQSYFELYDLLTTLYEDYFVAPVFTFTTNGAQAYPLPDGSTVTDVLTSLVAAPFYKLIGVDLGLSGNSNAFVTLKKFDFIGRNRYVFPQLTSTYLGVFNLRYRLLGNNIELIPAPSGGQYIRLWYIPRLNQLLKDTDIVDGISGWTEYLIVDAAIKALQKEESDVTALMMQKQALIKRIEESAMNRDAGQPDTISDTRSRGETWGGYGWDGGVGGY